MPTQRDKVILAMSGGVDSSVAAGLLLDAGYDVTGVFLCMGTAGGEGDNRGCCSPQDAADARRVAETLGIDLHVLNMGEAFERIVATFAAEYARGRTPNPCILCNTLIKFGRLVELADSLGARYVATGHHARMIDADAPAIGPAKARGKDQSYALFGIAREHLGRILLPVGEVDDKAVVRDRAKQLGLNVHDKPDSQDICFLADDEDVATLLARRAPQALRPGNVVDSDGNVLGTHDGYGRFTIGQRKGLGIAAGVPMYVTRIDPDTATVTLGPKVEVMGRSLTAAGANWHADVPDEFDALVKVRYNHPGAPGRVTVTADDTFSVAFAEDVAAITPGQAAVIYTPAGERLFGGGWIN